MAPPPDARPEPPPRRTQADRRAQTRAALVSAGRELFGEHGHAAVSTEAIVARAGVTRGALYHHFRDKNDLFAAVFEEVEAGLLAEMVAEMDARPTAVEGLLAGVGLFLDLAHRPDVRRITMVDAPSVLGWAEWRELEAHYALGTLTDRLRAAQAEGVVLAGDVDVIARLVFSTAVEAVMMISSADDPVAARARVEPALLAVAAGLLGAAG